CPTATLFSPDHKRIAILYALSITVFFFIGGFAIGLVRLKLLSPAAGSWRATSHGVGLLLLLFGLNVGPAYVPLWRWQRHAQAFYRSRRGHRGCRLPDGFAEFDNLDPNSRQNGLF